MLLTDNRKGTFSMGGDQFPVHVKDLATLVESYKTYDDVHIVKSNDVGQVCRQYLTHCLPFEAAVCRSCACVRHDTLLTKLEVTNVSCTHVSWSLNRGVCLATPAARHEVRLMALTRRTKHSKNYPCTYTFLGTMGLQYRVISTPSSGVNVSLGVLNSLPAMHSTHCHADQL